MKIFKPSTLCLFAASFVFFACVKSTTIPHPKRPPTVDAGPAQTITAPHDSVFLTAKITDSTSRIVGYLWSEVSGPNVPTIASPSSMSTLVTGLVPGTYVFQFEATDLYGLTGVDTMTVWVNQAVNTSGAIDTLAPIHNPYELEYIGNTSLNYAAAREPRELGAEFWTINSQPVAVRSVFKFDLSGIPANATIRSAQLTLFSNPTPYTANLSTPNYGSSNAFYIQRVSTAWDTANNATWNTQPEIDTTAQVLVPQSNQSSQDINADVTQLVKNIIASGNNYGFEIRLQTEVLYNSRIFCSSSYSDSTKRPQLVINY